MNVTWVLGWAIPAAWFKPLATRVFAGAHHQFILPRAGTAAELEALVATDVLIGYSLGAQLLLGAVDRLRVRAPIGLLAPIFAFPQERNRGGRIAGTQVSYLARWLRRDPSAALHDFYRRAGLDIPAELAPIHDLDALVWGLDQLMNGDLAAKLPTEAVAVCGSDDPLLDAARIHEVEPRVHIVPGATHHPATLLPALVQRLARAAPC